MQELDTEMKKYEESVKSFLKHGKIRTIEYAPKVLYHGSPESLDVINPRESTQSGKVVYATDNPMHALFFSIFRNSSQVRAHINERTDENGNYQVMYSIDERYEGALKETITDNPITIHVCNGEDFERPQGEQYISREWVSKDCIIIKPSYKITVNPKQVIKELIERKLLVINEYNKSKDFETVIDMLSMNYPFALSTERAKSNPEEFEKSYDNYIKQHFPELFRFSQKFRKYVREVMASNKSLDEKLREIRKKGLKLLQDKKSKEENDKKL